MHNSTRREPDPASGIMSKTHQTAAWVDDPGRGNANVRIRHDVPIPSPSAHEVLVKLSVSGICHSDVHLIDGDVPMEVNIAGHEGVGVVVRLGEGVERGMMGKTVGVKWVYSACGTCEICRVNQAYCPRQKNAGRVSGFRFSCATILSFDIRVVGIRGREFFSDLLW